MTARADDVQATTKTVYWHRDLPPLDAEPIEEHTVEARSRSVLGTIACRDQVWEQCYRDLMAQTEARLSQELGRLGGDCAHVYDAAIEPKRDDIAGEVWLHGRFRYMLYRRQASL